MKVKVIGFWGGYPKMRQASSCYLLHAGGKNILLDIGAGSVSVLQQYIDLSQIDAVIISHYHGDHFSDIFSLQHQVLIDMQFGIRDKKLLIYAPVHDFYIDELSRFTCTDVIGINAGMATEMGDVSFSFVKSKHIIDGLAVKVKCGEKVLVYTSDTEYTDEIRNFAEDCDVLLGDCSLYDEITSDVTGHMRAGILGKLAQDCGARRLLATHLPTYGEHSSLLTSIHNVYKGRADLAYEGLEISI